MEDLLPLRDARRIVDVDDGAFDAFQGFKSLFDDVFPCLGEDLDRHIVRDEIMVNQIAEEVIFRF